MKVVETVDATGTLADYTAQIGNGPIIVTSQGRPVAALVPLENSDLESVALGSNPQFLELIERSRARVRDEGGISAEELRRRLG
jgi:antitoxin (DNA-binding transcriptional repressor) of toxin-antitoxin stability system